MSSRLGAPGATRTPDPLLRRQLLYPLSYRRPIVLRISDCGFRIDGPETAAVIPHSAIRNPKSLLARPERIELPTCWFEASRSIQLSYGRPLLTIISDFELRISDCEDLLLGSSLRNPHSAIRISSWGERRDSNPQPLEPQSSALPLSYAHHAHCGFRIADFGLEDVFRRPSLRNPQSYMARLA